MFSSEFSHVSTDRILSSVLAKDDQQFLKGWVLNFINEFSQEQPRMVLLTRHSLYRVKWATSMEKPTKSHRLLLKDIKGIQVGYFLPEGDKKGDKALQHYGFRILVDPGMQGGSTIHYPWEFKLLQTAKLHKETVDAIVGTISKTREELVGDRMEVQELEWLLLSGNSRSGTLQNVFGVWPKRRSATMMPRSQRSGLEGVARRSVETAAVDILPKSKVQAHPPVLHTVPQLHPPEDQTSHPIRRRSNSLSSSSLSEGKEALGHQRSRSTLDIVTVEEPNDEDLLSISEHLSSTPNDTQEDTNHTTPEGSSVTKEEHKGSPDLVSSGESESPAINQEVPQAFKAQETEKGEKIESPPPKEKVEEVEEANPSPVPLEVLARREFEAERLKTEHSSRFAWSLSGLYRWIIQRQEPSSHIMLSIVLAFFIGAFNFSLLWALGLMYIIYKMDRHRLVKHQRAITYQMSISKKAANNLTRSGAEVKKDEETDTCHWFNTLLTKLWPKMWKRLALAVKESLTEQLQLQVELKKIPISAVKSIVVSGLDLGDTPPTFSGVTGVKPLFPDFQCDFDLRYFGPATVTLIVCLGVQSLQPVTVEIPIILNDFDVKGRMRCGFTFFPKPPFLHTLTAGFIEPPELHLSVRPLHTLDIIEIPFLDNWIQTAIKELLASTLVLPEKIELSYQNLFGTKLQEEKTITSVDFTTSEVRQENTHIHNQEIEKSRRDGEYLGLLHVKVIEGRKLLQEFIGVHATPYCILSTGPHEVFTTRNVKRSKAPQWNEFFELLVKKKCEGLEVTVMARDTVNARDDFLGMATLQFSEFGPEPKDFWVALERPNKKGDQMHAGDIHMQVRYVPPLDTVSVERSTMDLKSSQ